MNSKTTGWILALILAPFTGQQAHAFYNPAAGGWLNRDPIQQRGGLNLYAFALNRPLTVLDILGLANYRIGSPTEPPMTFDEDFVYDPNKKATAEDRWQWVRWGAGLHLYGELWRGSELEDATRAYARYRSGTGTDLEINYPKAYREDTNVRNGVDKEIAAAQRDAERRATTGGARFTMTGDAERLGDPTTENWQKTIGKHYIWGHADVEACGDQFTMTINSHEKDRYNFNRGAADIATGLPDNANGGFAILGWAKSFITNGKVVKKVTWKMGEVGKIEDPPSPLSR